MLKALIASSALAVVMAASSANAFTIFTDRATFEAAITIAYNEDFETLSGTNSFAGPITMPTGLTVSSQSNSLFSVGPGQSSNPTEAIGSNTPSSDSLNMALGVSATAVGMDLFQNNGGGTQFGSDITYDISLFLGGSSVSTHTTTVSPNGGSFFGVIADSAFDNFSIFSNSNSYEVADNVTVGDAAVPVPAALPMMAAGIAGLAMVAQRRKSA